MSYSLGVVTALGVTLETNTPNACKYAFKALPLAVRSFNVIA
jgi:hypothetical protein